MGGSDWRILADHLRERIVKPSSRPAAAIYLSFAVVLLGGLGNWATLWKVCDGTAERGDLGVSLCTYAFAILFTSCADLMLDSEVDNQLKFYLFAIAALLSFGSIFGIWYIVYKTHVSLLAALLMISPLWFTWWLINGSDARFKSSLNPIGSMGGSIIQG